MSKSQAYLQTQKAISAPESKPEIETIKPHYLELAIGPEMKAELDQLVHLLSIRPELEKAVEVISNFLNSEFRNFVMANLNGQSIPIAVSNLPNKPFLGAAGLSTMLLSGGLLLLLKELNHHNKPLVQIVLAVVSLIGIFIGLGMFNKSNAIKKRNALRKAEEQQRIANHIANLCKAIRTNVCKLLPTINLHSAETLLDFEFAQKRFLELIDYTDIQKDRFIQI